jgi:hypothetical protein
MQPSFEDNWGSETNIRQLSSDDDGYYYTVSYDEDHHFSYVSKFGPFPKTTRHFHVPLSITEDATGCQKLDGDFRSPDKCKLNRLTGVFVDKNYIYVMRQASAGMRASGSNKITAQYVFLLNKSTGHFVKTQDNDATKNQPNPIVLANSDGVQCSSECPVFTDAFTGGFAVAGGRIFYAENKLLYRFKLTNGAWDGTVKKLEEKVEKFVFNGRNICIGSNEDSVSLYCWQVMSHNVYDDMHAHQAAKHFDGEINPTGAASGTLYIGENLRPLQYREKKYNADHTKVWLQVDHRRVMVDNDGFNVPGATSIIDENYDMEFAPRHYDSLIETYRTEYEFDELDINGYARVIMDHPHGEETHLTVHDTQGDRTGVLHLRDNQTAYLEYFENENGDIEAASNFYVDRGSELVLPMHAHFTGVGKRHIRSKIEGMMTGVVELTVARMAYMEYAGYAQIGKAEINLTYVDITHPAFIHYGSVTVKRWGVMEFSRVHKLLVLDLPEVLVMYQGEVSVNYAVALSSKAVVQSEGAVHMDGTGPPGEMGHRNGVTKFEHHPDGHSQCFKRGDCRQCGSGGGHGGQGGGHFVKAPDLVLESGVTVPRLDRQGNPIDYIPASGADELLGGDAYGSMFSPIQMGSGGGHGSGIGGRGGGAIHWTISSIIDISGRISARGGHGDGLDAGGGSGGSILIEAENVTGHGLVDVQGGNGTGHGYGGAGGRSAIHCTWNFTFGGQLCVKGGLKHTPDHVRIGETPKHSLLHPDRIPLKVVITVPLECTSGSGCLPSDSWWAVYPQHICVVGEKERKDLDSEDSCIDSHGAWKVNSKISRSRYDEHHEHQLYSQEIATKTVSSSGTSTFLLDLPLGDYIVVIYNRKNNGLCCDYGPGKYKIELEDSGSKVIGEGDRFGSYVGYSFSVSPNEQGAEQFPAFPSFFGPRKQDMATDPDPNRDDPDPNGPVVTKSCNFDDHSSSGESCINTMPTHGGFGAGYLWDLDERAYVQWPNSKVHVYDHDMVYKGEVDLCADGVPNGNRDGCKAVMSLWGDHDGFYYTATWESNLITKYGPFPSNAFQWEATLEPERSSFDKENHVRQAGAITGDDNYVYAMRNGDDTLHIIHKGEGRQVKTIKLRTSDASEDTEHANQLFGGLAVVLDKIYRAVGRTVYRYDLATGTYDMYQFSVYAGNVPGYSTHVRNMHFDGRDLVFTNIDFWHMHKEGVQTGDGFFDEFYTAKMDGTTYKTINKLRFYTGDREWNYKDSFYFTGVDSTSQTVGYDRVMRIADPIHGPFRAHNNALSSTQMSIKIDQPHTRVRVKARLWWMNRRDTGVDTPQGAGTATFVNAKGELVAGFHFNQYVGDYIGIRVDDALISGRLTRSSRGSCDSGWTSATGSSDTKRYPDDAGSVLNVICYRNVDFVVEHYRSTIKVQIEGLNIGRQNTNNHFYNVENEYWGFDRFEVQADIKWSLDRYQVLEYPLQEKFENGVMNTFGAAAGTAYVENSFRQPQYREVKYDPETKLPYLEADHKYALIDNEGHNVAWHTELMDRFDGSRHARISNHERLVYNFDELFLTGWSRAVLHHPDIPYEAEDSFALRDENPHDAKDHLTFFVHHIGGDKTGQLHLRSNQLAWIEYVESEYTRSYAPCSFRNDQHSEFVFPKELHLTGIRSRFEGRVTGVLDLFVAGGTVEWSSTANTAYLSNSTYSMITHNGNFTFGTLTVKRLGKIELRRVTDSMFLVTGEFRVRQHGQLTINHGSIFATDAWLESEGVITAEGNGYVYGHSHLSPGLDDPLAPTGGVHAGQTKTSFQTGKPAAGQTYGSVYFPSSFGSAGGVSFRKHKPIISRAYHKDNPIWCMSSASGGSIHFVALEHLQLDGLITANGAPGAFTGAGGSGGAVLIETTNVTGHGTVSANGGDGDLGGGGGSGGRVAIHVDYANKMHGKYQTWGGTGGETAASGTVYKYESKKGLGYREIKYNTELHKLEAVSQHTWLMVNNNYKDASERPEYKCPIDFVCEYQTIVQDDFHDKLYEFDEMEVNGKAQVAFQHPKKEDEVIVVIHKLIGDNTGLIHTGVKHKDDQGEPAENSQQRVFVEVLEGINSRTELEVSFWVEPGSEIFFPENLVVRSAETVIQGRIVGVEYLEVERDAKIVFSCRDMDLGECAQTAILTWDRGNKTFVKNGIEYDIIQVASTFYKDHFVYTPKPALLNFSTVSINNDATMLVRTGHLTNEKNQIEMKFEVPHTLVRWGGLCSLECERIHFKGGLLDIEPNAKMAQDGMGVTGDEYGTPTKGCDGVGGMGGSFASFGGNNQNIHPEQAGAQCYGSLGLGSSEIIKDEHVAMPDWHRNSGSAGCGAGEIKKGMKVGRGGGVFSIVVGNMVKVDGELTSSGTNGSPSRASGGGSGGSIYIHGMEVYGHGLIRADGGDSGAAINGGYGGGGSGGRIALYLRTKLRYKGTLRARGGACSECRGDRVPNPHYYDLFPHSDPLCCKAGSTHGSPGTIFVECHLEDEPNLAPYGLYRLLWINNYNRGPVDPNPKLFGRPDRKAYKNDMQTPLHAGIRNDGFDPPAKHNRHIVDIGTGVRGSQGNKFVGDLEKGAIDTHPWDFEEIKLLGRATLQLRPVRGVSKTHKNKLELLIHKLHSDSTCLINVLDMHRVRIMPRAKRSYAGASFYVQDGGQLMVNKITELLGSADVHGLMYGAEHLIMGHGTHLILRSTGSTRCTQMCEGGIDLPTCCTAEELSKAKGDYSWTTVTIAKNAAFHARQYDISQRKDNDPSRGYGTLSTSQKAVDMHTLFLEMQYNSEIDADAVEIFTNNSKMEPKSLINANHYGFWRARGPGRGGQGGSSYSGGGMEGISGNVGFTQYFHGKCRVVSGQNNGPSQGKYPSNSESECNAPSLWGSGGATESGGGLGGGAVRFIASGMSQLDGTIGANGEDAQANPSGGGSGGSLWIQGLHLEGHGTVTARGGQGSSASSGGCYKQAGGGGGGGRILTHSPNHIPLDILNNRVSDGGAASISLGSKFGGDGTVCPDPDTNQPPSDGRRLSYNRDPNMQPRHTQQNWNGVEKGDLCPPKTECSGHGVWNAKTHSCVCDGGYRGIDCGLHTPDEFCNGRGRLDRIVRKPDAEISVATRSKAWRVINAGFVADEWRVCDLKFYADPLCTKVITGGSPIAGHGSSGIESLPESTIPSDKNNAFDADANQCSKVWTGCEDCQFGTKDTWIGMNYTSEQQISCVRIKQWNEPGFENHAKSIRIQSASQKTDAGKYQWRDAWVTLSICEGVNGTCNDYGNGMKAENASAQGGQTSSSTRPSALRGCAGWWTFDGPDCSRDLSGFDRNGDVSKCAQASEVQSIDGTKALRFGTGSDGLHIQSAPQQKTLTLLHSQAQLRGSIASSDGRIGSDVSLSANKFYKDGSKFGFDHGDRHNLLYFFDLSTKVEEHKHYHVTKSTLTCKSTDVGRYYVGRAEMVPITLDWRDSAHWTADGNYTRRNPSWENIEGFKNYGEMLQQSQHPNIQSDRDFDVDDGDNADGFTFDGQGGCNANDKGCSHSKFPVDSDFSKDMIFSSDCSQLPESHSSCKSSNTMNNVMSGWMNQASKHKEDPYGRETATTVLPLSDNFGFMVRATGNKPSRVGDWECDLSLEYTTHVRPMTELTLSAWVDLSRNGDNGGRLFNYANVFSLDVTDTSEGLSISYRAMRPDGSQKSACVIEYKPVYSTNFHHVAVTANQNGIELFVDGRPLSTPSTCKNVQGVVPGDNTADLEIAVGFNGAVDDARIHIVSLSWDDIASVWMSRIESEDDVGESPHCTCDAGFVGYRCERTCDAEIDCNGHGSCDAFGHCVCDPCFAGPDCKNECSTNGTCVAGRCDCFDSNHGYFCEETCSGHGRRVVSHPASKHTLTLQQPTLQGSFGVNLDGGSTPDKGKFYNDSRLFGSGKPADASADQINAKWFRLFYYNMTSLVPGYHSESKYYVDKSELTCTRPDLQSNPLRYYSGAVDLVPINTLDWLRLKNVDPTYHEIEELLNYGDPTQTSLHDKYVNPLKFRSRGKAHYNLRPNYLDDMLTENIMEPDLNFGFYLRPSAEDMSFFGEWDCSLTLEVTKEFVATCDCDIGWRGIHCEKPGCPGEGQDCSGNGVCNSFEKECVCNVGWTGPGCNIPNCVPEDDPDNNCYGRGICDSNLSTPRCVDCKASVFAPGGGIEYEGWMGVGCEKPCVYGIQSKSNSDRCACHIGYSGEGCNMECNGHGDIVNDPNPNRTMMILADFCEPLESDEEECDGKILTLSIEDTGIAQYQEPGKVAVSQKNQVSCGAGTHGLDDYYCRVDDSNNDPNLWTVKACHQGRCDSTEVCGQSQTAGTPAVHPTRYEISCLLMTGGKKCECTFEDGYWGSLCEQPLCPGIDQPCSGHGECNGNTRICECEAGWAGIGCHIPDCQGEPNCFGRGTCDKNRSQPTCVDCSAEWKPDVVPSHANRSVSGVFQYREKGEWIGYHGPGCNLACNHGSACSYTGTHGYPMCKDPKPEGVEIDTACECDPGWTGEGCDIMCNGAGRVPADCIRGEDGSYDATECKQHQWGPEPKDVCICDYEKGFWGTECEIKGCPGHGDLEGMERMQAGVGEGKIGPCSGRGECGGDGKCTCNPGWKGLGCDVPDCPGEPNCFDRGFCNNTLAKPVCQKCSKGWNENKNEWIGWMGEGCEKSCNHGDQDPRCVDCPDCAAIVDNIGGDIIKDPCTEC